MSLSVRSNQPGRAAFLKASSQTRLAQPRPLQGIAGSLAALIALVVPASAQGIFPGQSGPGSAAPVPAGADASHSGHGAAFDQGPRQQATLQTGIGNVHFPVTTRSPLAQRFFDQGMDYAFSFEWLESERSFRQTAMLDPDCGMAYWGMAMAAPNRGGDFIKLAQAKESKLTDRERRYIEALAINFGNSPNRVQENIHALEELAIDYPEDLNAKVILAGALWRQGTSSKAAIDALLRLVIDKSPMHPGAHHLRIHLWDGPDARAALDSARVYGATAPAIGHADHMPGHIFARLGMWNEAVQAMYAGAAAERHYFYTQHRLPFESWNYGHNEAFLISNLGYAGRIRDGLAEAQELIDVPRDPQYSSGWSGLAGEGRFGKLRMRIRGEQWDAILSDPDAGWTSSPDDQAWLLYSHGMAHLGKADLPSARKDSADLEALKASGDVAQCARLELKGRVEVTSNDFDHGLADLKAAAELERTHLTYRDPPPFPHPLYESVAWGLLQAKRYAECEAELQESLKDDPHNGFALCLLIQALCAEGKSSEAAAVDRELQAAWVHADPDLPALERIQPLGFGRWRLDTTGRLSDAPAHWEPFPAADFKLLDPNGRTLRLSDFYGQNLLLIFYLGGGCPNCVLQLQQLAKEAARFGALHTRLAAVSAEAPAVHKSFLSTTPDFPILLLSDTDNRAARSYQAYDEFENLPLHGAILIDARGRTWWFRTGSEPFTDFAFLEGEIQRMEAFGG